MSVVSSDLVFYSSEEMPQDDTSAAGGDINSGLRVQFTDIVSSDIVEAVSSSSGDTQNITVYGRDTFGVIQVDTFGLSGAVPTSGAQVFERVLKVVLSSTPVGSVTVSDSSTTTTIAIIPPGESGMVRPFYNAIANPAGGADKIFYEKIFLKNNNTTKALQGATITEVVTGIYNLTEFGLEQSSQYTESVFNRLTAPTGVTSYGSGTSGIPGSDLNPLDYQGLWLRLTADNGEVAQDSFYQLRVEGATT